MSADVGVAHPPQLEDVLPLLVAAEALPAGAGQAQGLLAVVGGPLAQALGVLVDRELARFQDAVEVVPRPEERKRRGQRLCCDWLSVCVFDLLEDFFPEPSALCLRPSRPSCSTVWALSGSAGMVAALSASAGVTVETEGSSSSDWLSFMDSMGSVDSAAASVPGPAAANWPVGDGSETNLSANSEWGCRRVGVGGLTSVGSSTVYSWDDSSPKPVSSLLHEDRSAQEVSGYLGGVDPDPDPGADLLSETCSCLMTSISSSCNPDTTAVRTCEHRPGQCGVRVGWLPW